MCLGTLRKGYFFVWGQYVSLVYNIICNQRERYLSFPKNIIENRQCTIPSCLRYLHSHEMARESSLKCLHVLATYLTLILFLPSK